MNPDGGLTEQRLILADMVKNEIDNYTFQYYGGILPPKGSFHQDLWGFNTGKSTGWFPSIYISDDGSGKKKYKCFPSGGGDDIFLAGSDRTVDEESIILGVLHKIIYPTHGSTIYDFQPNDFYDPTTADKNIFGGGIRIEQIRKLDEKGLTKLKQTYNYLTDGHSSGVQIYDLAYATPTTLSQKPLNLTSTNGFDYDYSGTLEYTNPLIHQLFTVRYSHNCYPQGNLEGYQVGYTSVTRIEEGNGKLIREYYQPQNYQENSSYVRTSKMNAWGYNNYDFNDPIYLQEGNQYFTKSCHSRQENGNTIYYYLYTAPNGGSYEEIVSSCNTSYYDQHNMANNLSYHGGRGYFTPIGYEYDFNTVNLDPFQVYDVQGSDFTAYKTDLFLTNPQIESYEWLVNNCMSEVGPFTVNYSATFDNWVKTSGTNIFPFPPLSHSEGDQLIYSKLKSEKFFQEGEDNPCKQIDYSYQLFGEENNMVFGLVYQPSFLVSSTLGGCPTDAANTYNLFCSFGRSYFYSNVHGAYIPYKGYSKYYYKVNCTALLKSVIETEYFPTGSLAKNTIYDYTDHYLLSYINEPQSDNSLSEVKIKYPFNFSTSPYTHMTNLRMLDIPIETIRLKDELVVGGTINTYRIHEFDIAPDKLFKYTSTIPIQYNQCSFDGSTPNTSFWNDLATFDNYDDKVNLLQYHIKDNIPITFLWGYNRTVPIAKIEGSTYDEVMNVIGVTIEDLQTKTDEELRTIFTNLRTSLPSSRITSFTYNPLVGPSSNNDYNGIPTYYFYDGLNRLITIKDQDTYIKKYIEYHYYEK